MGNATVDDRRHAEALVAVLEETAAALAKMAPDGDVGWLRPLAVLTAEIEYSALRRSTVDMTSLADECSELQHLLSSGRDTEDEFASRYRAARRASPSLARLHHRLQTACDHVLPTQSAA